MEPSGAEDPELFPSLPLLNIKDEPIDEGYNAALQPQPPASRIKEELDQLEVKYALQCNLDSRGPALHSMHTSYTGALLQKQLI